MLRSRIRIQFFTRHEQEFDIEDEGFINLNDVILKVQSKDLYKEDNIRPTIPLFQGNLMKVN